MIFIARSIIIGSKQMKQLKFSIFKILVSAMVVFFLFFIVMDNVSYARAGGGRSSGSRGFSSGGGYSRSTPYQSPYQQGSATQKPQQPASPNSPGRSFLYGLGGGLVGGMIGSMLFGRSGGGWGGGFSFGDLIILIVIAGIIFFIIKRYRTRRASQMGVAEQNAYGPYDNNEPAYEPGENSVTEGLRHITDMDPTFNENTFRESVEDMFFKIQSAWTKRDLSGVRNLLTPEMYNTFQNDVNNLITNKQYNKLENLAVRQVDIVEAIQDQGADYITIHFLASLLDYNVNETTGNVMSGSSIDPVKFTEYWTFTRRVGDRSWALSAITQEQDYR